MHISWAALIVNTATGPLQLQAKLFQKSIWPAVSAVARGERLRGPVVVELDPTTYCDAACPECISGRLLNTRRFAGQRLLTLADELRDAGVRAVILIGGGEPLLHPATDDLISRLGHAGLSLGVTTNGTQIHRHIEVLARFATWTRVSVDAGSPRIYELFRPHRSGRNYFSRVIANIRLLAKRKRGKLGFSFLLMRRPGDTNVPSQTNAGDLYTAALLARDAGCDYFEVKPSYDLGHYLHKQPPGWTAQVTEQLAAVRTLRDSAFEIVSPTTLDTVLSGAQNLQPKDYSVCLVSELRTLVTPDGAYICPYFRGDPRRSYGDPLSSSFRQLWNSRRRQVALEATQPCRDCTFHCIRHDTNRALHSITSGEPPPELASDFDLFL